MRLILLALVITLTACASRPAPKPDPWAECYMVFDAKMNFLGCMVGPWPADPAQ